MLVDEAYIHFSDAQSCISLVKEHPQLLILQTFSKLYGMAGARLGLAIGQAPLLKRLEVYDGDNVAAASTLLAGLASLNDPQLVPQRKAENARLRDHTIAWLGERGWRCTASQTNCFMIDMRGRHSRWWIGWPSTACWWAGCGRAGRTGCGSVSATSRTCCAFGTPLPG